MEVFLIVVVCCLCIIFSPVAQAEEIRLLPLEGVYNVRDLGGYPAASGKTVKWRMVYRSGDLNKLSVAGQEYLQQRNIRTIVDFRTPAEILKYPHQPLASTVRTVLLPIDPASILDLSQLNEETSPTFMLDMNKSLVEACQEQYTRFFAVLAEEDAAPLLFNCSAGKDRTGFATALFLCALGVSKEIVFQDYMLSKSSLQGKYNNAIAAKPWLGPLLSVEPEYLEAAFALMDKKYGGVESYLRNQLGVNLEHLRELYTE